MDVHIARYPNIVVKGAEGATYMEEAPPLSSRGKERATTVE